MPGPHVLLNALLAGGRRADRLTHVEHLPGRPASFAPWPAWADAELVAGYHALGIDQPWTHQVEAAEAAWSGRHTVLSTATGSGKSLAFWLPILSAIRAAQAARTLDPGRIETVTGRATALYLAPTKALAADQLHGVQELATAAGVTVRAVTCDGDTPREARRWAREHGEVVLTNPDFLHFALLPGHARWSGLLRGLRFIVVDECHAFRGVLGAHVAAVLRRLRRLAALYGAEPTVILASATTADPAASAARLLGVQASAVHAVTVNGAGAGRRDLALWQPPPLIGAPPQAEGDGDDAHPLPAGRQAFRTATAEAGDLLTDLTLAGARTLTFVRSRRGAESVAAAAQRQLTEVSPALSGQVAAYRGGYLPEERRALEESIRGGRLRALATTNALELGVDISGLDAVLIAGWPGTRVSFWQQAGRAGRAGADALVVLIAREDPLDTYLINHPGAVVDAPVEATVFDPTNPYVLAPHLCAAAAESPLRSADLELFGPGTAALLDELVTMGLLRRRPSGWYWTSAERASLLTDLRGAGGPPVRVVEQGTGRLVGTVDAASADATVHPGAVYVHQGDNFLVRDLDLTEGVALVDRAVLDYGTWARWVTSVAITEVREELAWGPARWGFGAVEVTTQVVSFDRRRLVDQSMLGSQPLDLPARTLPTTAVWWTAPSAVLDRAGVDGADLPGALHAAEHASIGLLPLLATCDRWDLGGVSIAMHPDTEEPTVFVYDGYPGGAGFAERGFRLGATWLRATMATIAHCPCADGCPACVQSPKCGNANNPLDKAAALRLLTALLAAAPDGAEPAD